MEFYWNHYWCVCENTAILISVEQYSIAATTISLLVDGGRRFRCPSGVRRGVRSARCLWRYLSGFVGVDLVLARERELGRKPMEQAFSSKGFDILSTDSKGDTFRSEVKARIDDAADFFVTHNGVLTGKNALPRHRLVLVRVASAEAQHDEVRYLDDAFSATDLSDFEVTGIRGDWAKMWDKGRSPF
jgi:hypothetical protein